MSGVAIFQNDAMALPWGKVRAANGGVLLFLKATFHNASFF